MSVYEAKRPIGRRPSHPGALLADIIPATGKTRVEIAGLLGLSRQQLYGILREKKPVSPSVAARLGKMFGDGAAIWLRMQVAHDGWRVGRGAGVSVTRSWTRGKAEERTIFVARRHSLRTGAAQPTSTGSSATEAIAV